MIPRLLGLDGVRDQPQGSLVQLVATRENLVREIAGWSRQVRPFALQPGQHMRGSRSKIIAPLGDVLGTEWLGDEIGVVAAVFGQRSMHLGGAYPELASQHQEKDIRIGQIGWPPTGGQQRVVEIPCQVIQRLCPAISLIANETEQHTERVLFRPVFAVKGELYGREQWRGIGELGALDQKT